VQHAVVLRVVVVPSHVEARARVVPLTRAHAVVDVRVGIQHTAVHTHVVRQYPAVLCTSEDYTRSRSQTHHSYGPYVLVWFGLVWFE